MTGEGLARFRMKSPLLIVLVALLVMTGSAMALMNKACKSSKQHAWCAPVFERHHAGTVHGWEHSGASPGQLQEIRTFFSLPI